MNLDYGLEITIQIEEKNLILDLPRVYVIDYTKQLKEIIKLILQKNLLVAQLINLKNT